ncbi:MAG: GAF domain-containing protein, partial [Betaproteobacteria bacterium]
MRMPAGTPKKKGKPAVSPRARAGSKAPNRAGQLAAELALINRIQQGMAAKLSFKAIVDLVGDTLREMFGSDDLSIRWWDAEADTVEQLYSVEHGQHLPKDPPVKVRATNKPLVRLLREGIGSYLSTREEQMAAGIGGAAPGTDWCLSIIGVPIRGARRVLGVIVIENYEREHAFGDADLQALTTIGATLGTALETARLLDETQRLLKETERRSAELAVINAIQQGMAREPDLHAVVNLVGDKLRDMFESDDISIHWFDKRTSAAQVLYVVERGERKAFPPFRADLTLPMMQALARGETVLARNRAEIAAMMGLTSETVAQKVESFTGTHESRTIVWVPIATSSDALAALVLESADREDAYSETDLSLLQTIAASMGVALQNAQLFRQTQAALSHQTATADILRVISASPTDTQPVFNAIVDTAVKLLVCDRAAFVRVEGGTYVPSAIATPAGFENDRWTDPVPIDPAANFPSRAIVARQTIHYPDWDAIELPPRQKMVRDSTGARASLVVPLLREGESIGALMLFRNRPGGFSDQEIALAESFRDQAVIAVENVRLFNDMKDALERQTATAEILRVISDSPTSTEPVFDSILASGARLCEADMGLVLRYEAGVYQTVATLVPDPAFDAFLRQPIKAAPGTGLGRVASTKTPVHIPDLKDDAAYRAGDPLRMRSVEIGGVRTWLGVPMLREGELIGALA